MFFFIFIVGKDYLFRGVLLSEVSTVLNLLGTHTLINTYTVCSLYALPVVFQPSGGKLKLQGTDFPEFCTQIMEIPHSENHAL